jgi:DNA gyrase inhibitor GyrI
MNKNEVRIITLPKMKVVSFHCMSETPEDDVTKKMLEFVNNHQLSNFRHFGFNNPNPTSDSSVYGYEMWITTDVDYPNETMKEFNGGLYASISTYMSEIGNRWNELAKYVQESEEYEIDFTPSNEFGVASHQWLEECVNFEHFFNPNISFTEKQLDLLLPIKIK